MEDLMRTLAVIQARMGSMRLPNKVMKMIGDRPMIDLLLERIANSKLIDKIIIATSDAPENLELIRHVEGLGYEVFSGSEKNVLDRYYQAAKKYKPDSIVRITGDCPLIDAGLTDSIIQEFLNRKIDYLSNNLIPSFPDGLDVEVFSFTALEVAKLEATSAYDLEHVTPYIRTSIKFKAENYSNEVGDLSSERWTVDEPEDFELVSKIFQNFYPKTDFKWKEILVFSRERPDIFEINRHLVRNEGAVMPTGQKLWRRAKRVIPGGGMLLSKRPEMFLPDYWPTYFSKAKGCKVWDLDGNQYTDMSLMGVGTNSLGYGHPLVDQAVTEVLTNGNMSTLNCPEEVLLAERLVAIHPWSDMVRFARSGGEANAIAIRIARAASGKDKVAICGYHGWHDWYLSANLSSNEKLDGHLLPGLDPKGVPRNLEGSVLPFAYNKIEELESLINSHEIGVIKMEVMRNHPPEDKFLERVRALAIKNNIVLIFDECTSGFRETFGGLHKKYGVNPDMAIFGKALGNGYGITAVIGRREVMEAAQSTFISSTFWTERIGPSAAIKTLEVMEQTKSWEVNSKTGIFVKNAWISLANKHGLKIACWGIEPMPGFSFSGEKALLYKTYITQEMLKHGYLAGNSFYACIEHSPIILEDYFNILDDIFNILSQCETGKLDIHSLIKGPVCHAGFRRLN
jgi:glutamate-1-semialdehyde 2,1-aminomutase